MQQEEQEDDRKDDKKRKVVTIILYVALIGIFLGVQGFNAYSGATSEPIDPIQPHIIGNDDDFTYWEVVIRPSHYDDAIRYIEEHNGQIISEKGRIGNWWTAIEYKTVKE